MRWNFVYALGMSMFGLIINLLAVGFLLRSKNLKKSRFNTLVLYLSISDCCLLVQIIIHTFFEQFKDDNDGGLYGCMVMKHSMGGTLCFTQWQTAMICMERLQATFQREIRILKKLTSIRSLGISFFASQLYSILPLVYEISQGPQPCDPSYTFRKSFLFSVDIPLFCTYWALVTLYAVVIYRMVNIVREWKAEVSTGHTLTRNRLSNIKRMKMNMVTLGIILVVTSLAVLPREVCSVVSTFVDLNDRLLKFGQIGNYVILLNPLIDPFIYVLRIEEVRNTILCCSTRNRVEPINIRVQPQNNTASTSRTVTTGPFMSGRKL